VTGLLEGVRVVDVTTVLAGPYAAYQLGLFGADVVKVEMPGTGDLAREMGDEADLAEAAMGAAFLAQNSGKRSVTLDLKTPGGREALERIVAGADVLVENMRPGVMERLGVGWTRLREVNPRLVYCAVSGFGQDGPLAQRPAYDQIIQGMSGMCDVTGWPSDDPLRVGFPICDTLGGLAAAMAVCAALVRRDRDGVGSFLDVSMLETAITAMGWVTSEHLISGHEPQRHGNDNAASSPSGTFHTASGLLNIAANTQEQFESLCVVCEREDLIGDHRFLTRALRKRHRRELTGELESALVLRPAADWETLLADARVPVGRVLTLAEAFDLDQVKGRELVHEVPVAAPGRTSVPVLGSGVHVDGEALGPRFGPPTLGEHTEAVLVESGLGSAEIARLRADGAL
jgi:crotonobetainyl-CoA:carnitine CoA-transferase CaiB-like acyl-CoA transferase